MKNDAKQVDHVSGKSAQIFAEAQKNFPPPEASPHIRGDNTTRNIMMWMIIALIPSMLGAGYYFGFRVWGLYLVAIITAQLCEIAWFKLCKRELTWDLSAVVTAILLTANMPPSAPWYFPVIGSAFAIIVVKEFFGGIGFNFINPALGGRALLVGLFFTKMFEISWPDPPFNRITPDVVSSATPLAILNEGGSLSGQELFNTFVGNIGGRLGETSTLLILIGAAILLYKKIIHLRIPLTMLGTIAVIAFVFDGQNFFTADLATVLGYVFGGGAVFGAFFMATDYSTSPTTPKGEVIYGICAGMLLMGWRLFTSMPEGMTFILLIMNCFVPLIDYLIIPRVYGEKRT